jgi:hypothetical protein
MSPSKKDHQNDQE